MVMNDPLDALAVVRKESSLPTPEHTMIQLVADVLALGGHFFSEKHAETYARAEVALVQDGNLYSDESEDISWGEALSYVATEMVAPDKVEVVLLEDGYLIYDLRPFDLSDEDYNHILDSIYNDEQGDRA